MTDIPSPVLDYAASDAETTLRLGIDLLEKGYALGGEGLLTHGTQLRASLALHCAGLNGFEIRLEAVDELRRNLDTEIDECTESLRSLGIPMRLPGVQKALRAEACRAANAAGIELRNVKKAEGISLAEDNLRDLACFSPAIAAYLTYRDVEKRLSLLPLLPPEGRRRVYPSFGLLVETGRTSCSGPNLQQVPKTEEVRSLYSACEGSLLFVADYKFIELCSLAQVCLIRYRKSRMAELINQGADLHVAFAAQIFKKDASEVTKAERQRAKAANFGFPGGLGAKAFLEFANKTYGIEISLQECEALRGSWLATFPEMKLYLEDDPRHQRPVVANNPFHMTPQIALATIRKIARGELSSTKGIPYGPKLVAWAKHVAMPALCTPGQPFDEEFDYAAALSTETVATTTGRLRAGCSYTQARNTPFQGLAADGAKLALFELLRAGFSIVGFVHDEIICEILDDSKARTNAAEAARLMVAGMAEVHPDVRVGVEWALTLDWSRREILASGETFSKEALA